MLTKLTRRSRSRPPVPHKLPPKLRHPRQPLTMTLLRRLLSPRPAPKLPPMPLGLHHRHHLLPPRQSLLPMLQPLPSRQPTLNGNASRQ